ncbi:MarR family winged helix-turn-helix transcriptional regulator [Streptomyces sp. NBC_01361]|uniref:MarR family winged helix-turn-helix transcriptional regulator n=1 Tax=Streptomyces sp. NBC_01361 TaxID=2903838 RepID=UPI002E31CD38|nr:MarR family transcriptional regulator [Streptomyces sp. NBC_01361]
MRQQQWLNEQEAHVWRSFLDLRRRIEAVINQQLNEDAGLSSVDYELVVPLSEAPDGVLRARDLGRMVGWERSRLSHQVRRMEQRGLVAREDCATDARGLMIRLTPEGRAAITAAAPEHVKVVRRYFFDSLTKEEVATLAAVYDRLLAKIDSDHPGAGPS